MGIKHGDQLFVFYDANQLPTHRRYSYFGTNFGDVNGFIEYIDGYIFAVNALFDEYSSCDKHRNDVLDTIIYPLCFNYRHIVELYIKYFYFKYSVANDAEKVCFIKHVSHRLNRAWNETRPHVQRLLQKISNPIDITLFDDFINQIDAFDSDSFRMRYPIKTDLTPVHSAPVKLDVVGLHHKMIGLFRLFAQADAEIEGVFIDNTCSDGFADTIRTLYCDGKEDIHSIMKALRNVASEQQARQATRDPSYTCFYDISSIDSSPSPKEKHLENLVLQLPVKHATILALLTQAGSSIVDYRYRIATDENEHKKDFFKLLEVTLKECSSFIDLESTYSNYEMCYALLEKSAEIPLKWLEASIPVMERSL